MPGKDEMFGVCVTALEMKGACLKYCYYLPGHLIISQFLNPYFLIENHQRSLYNMHLKSHLECFSLDFTLKNTENH